MMDKKPDTKLTPEIAEEICQRTASAAVLAGSIAQIGPEYLLTLDASGCSNGKALASTEATASDKSHVLDALGKMASDIRNKLGESLGTVQKFDTPLEQATTPSLEALQAYSFGRRAMSGSGDWSGALPFFQRAISLDPKFAIAYARLGMCYRNVGEGTLGSQNAQKAYELRERASELERFYIDSHYYQIAVADLEKTRQVCELWARTYPRDFTPRVDLADVYIQLGQYGEALAESRQAVRLNPNGVDYAEVVFSDVSLNRLSEASSTAEEAQARNLDSPTVHFFQYYLAFLQNDEGGTRKQVAWSAGRPGLEDVLLSLESYTAAYSGRLGEARDLSLRAVLSARQAEEIEVSAEYDVEAALREALFGNAMEARQRAAAASRLSNGRDVEFGAALALALAGDAARAGILAEDLARRFPEDTIVRFNYLPTIHAQMALSADNSFEALQILKTARPYELGSEVISPMALYPAYVRGEAYLAAHQGGEAAAEFQKILAHPGLVLNQPIGALAHLGLGRAYAVQNDTANAKVAYQDFLALWKDADPDIPILKQAKSEYEKLQ
jgi:eukaryotic-like serine/threonine-protein kinase